MKSNFIQVKRLKPELPANSASLASALERQTVLHAINEINWPEFSYKPTVNFRIGHTGDKICLKFYVREQAIRAMETKINGAVHKDSCVEFFVSFDGKNYYNFEFNCIGTPHLAYGEGRHNRQRVPEDTVRKIVADPSLGHEPFDTRTGDFSWDLTVIIPTGCLVFSPGIVLGDTEAAANFYKCGDDLPQPHFVTWNPVQTENPDYHRPEYFGRLKFD